MPQQYSDSTPSKVPEIDVVLRETLKDMEYLTEMTAQLMVRLEAVMSPNTPPPNRNDIKSIDVETGHSVIHTRIVEVRSNILGVSRLISQALDRLEI